jgi:FkbM family methyltransferase
MFKMKLHDNKNEYITKNILNCGYWDKYKTELLNEIIKDAIKFNKNYIFIDIGSNIGYFSLFCASFGMKTISFEPIDKNYNLFLESIRDNGYNSLINLKKVALGNKRGMGKFNIMNENMGCCTTVDFLFNRKPDYILEANIFLADDYLFDVNEDMIVKIDVENMEKEVIEGMAKTLRKDKIKYIFIEISKISKSIPELFDILLEYKYTKGIIIDNIKDNKETINIIDIIDTDSKHLENNSLYVSLEEIRNIHINSPYISQMDLLLFK